MTPAPYWPWYIGGKRVCTAADAQLHATRPRSNGLRCQWAKLIGAKLLRRDYGGQAFCPNCFTPAEARTIPSLPPTLRPI